MSAIDFPEIDSEGVNVTASALLDQHHVVVGVSGYGDEIIDNCEVCGMAAGWIGNHFGHATMSDLPGVHDWMAGADNGSLDPTE